MTEGTKKANNLTEEELAKHDDERFKEISAKSEEERTPEEKNELNELKERYSKRVQKRIDKEVWARKATEEQLEEERRRREELESRLKDLENKLKTDNQKPVHNEFVTIGDKKFYTDEALMQQIRDGKITEAEAVRYQQDRLKEEAVVEAEKRLEERRKAVEDNNIRRKDAEWVLEHYPNFSKKLPDGSINPNFNPEDPLYKLATDIYKEGYAANPKGLSLAIKRAKQILNIKDERIDSSDDLHIDSGTPPDKPKRKDKKDEITLSDDEKIAAERIYLRGDIINPKTGRPYQTAEEAHAAALEAKRLRRAK